jgi:hypothetical protein
MNPTPADPRRGAATTDDHRSSGMKQTLRIAIPLVVLVAVVFWVTHLSRYVPKVDEQQATKSSEPPLRFGSSIRAWNPFGSPQERAFPGFYERQGDAAGPKNSAAFWFENRNKSSVTLQLKGVSCSSCSGGRVAAIPPELTRQLLQVSVFQGLPQGLVSGLPTAMVGPAAQFAPDRGVLAWQSFNFRDNPHATYTVPAADNPTGTTPQWGILELLFSVGDLGPKTITADFDVQIDATRQAKSFGFSLSFEGVDPFSLSIKEVALGEINETTKEQRFELVAYSGTRGPEGSLGDLAPPVASVEMPSGSIGEPGPFVSVGTPVRVPEAELLALTVRISEQQKRPVRLIAAYRVPVVVNPQVGEKKIDLGPLERVVSVTVPNTVTTRTLAVTGRVRGGVWLDDERKDLRLADTYKRPFRATYRVVTEKPDAELVLVLSECKPDFMKVALEKLPPATDRGYYELKIDVPAESKAGPWGGSIVLQLKGPKPQQIRIPVYGKGG